MNSVGRVLADPFHRGRALRPVVMLPIPLAWYGVQLPEQANSMVTPRDLTERLASALGDRLVIERELDGGGMSRVFVALEGALDRRVVVKVLPEELSTALSRERFRREILTSATLQHPNIVSVFAAGDADGLLYFVMPFVDGESLRSRLQRDGPLSPAAAVSIMRDVLRALAFAHDRGVVHRDIKPDNVLLSHGAAVVADFGVARAFATARQGTTGASATLTGVGMSLGTPAYMAPEQVAGDTNLDARTDLYALGAMAYEALCGRAVFPRDTVADIMRAHLSETPVPPHEIRPGMPAALEAAVLRCLEKNPARRPQSAMELLHLLDDPAVVSGAVATTAQPARHGGRRELVRRVGIALTGLAAAFGAVAIATRGGGVPDAAVRVPVPTIAVLPLVSASADTTDRYLSFGVTDEIISALARVEGIRVASRAAAEEGQRNGLTLAQLAERFGVSHALEGTIQRAGSDLRVAVRLLSTSDGLTAWSEVFDGSTADLLDMQRYIAQSIATAVRADLGGAADSAIRLAAHRPDPRAHDAYLRAHYELARRGEGDLTNAIALLKEAVAIDTQYAVAWAELAQAYTVLPLYGQGGAAALHAEAMQAAQRALATDSTLAAAHAALGNLRNAQWRWDDGAQALRRAVALDSTYAPAFQWLGENRMLNGDIRAAEVALARAVALDSTLAVARALHGIALALLGNSAPADSELVRAIAAAPSVPEFRVMRGTALAYGNRWADAIRELEVARVLEPASPLVLGTLGYVHARAGNRDAVTALERALASADGRVGTRSAAAKIKLGLGDTVAALPLLELAVRDRDPLFASEPLASPVFDLVRRSERFRRVLDAAGLDGERLSRPCC